MPLKIASLMELIVALAVGFAAWRYEAGSYRLDYLNFRHFELLTGYFLPGVAIVGALGTWLEAARRRSPACWGLGRRTWSVAGLYILFVNLSLAAQLVQNRLHGNYWWAAGGFLGGIARMWDNHYYDLGWVIAAVWITSRISRQAGDPAPDARERAGQVFAAVAILASLLGGIMCMINDFRTSNF
jgi:hypothetical protein